MVFNNFFNTELTCTNCGQVLQAGEEVFIHLTLPDEKKMPVGVLDKVLSKYSSKVYCENCYKK